MNKDISLFNRRDLRSKSRLQDVVSTVSPGVSWLCIVITSPAGLMRWSEHDSMRLRVWPLRCLPQVFSVQRYFHGAKYNTILSRYVHRGKTNRSTWAWSFMLVKIIHRIVSSVEFVLPVCVCVYPEMNRRPVQSVQSSLFAFSEMGSVPTPDDLTRSKLIRPWKNEWMNFLNLLEKSLFHDQLQYQT